MADNRIELIAELNTDDSIKVIKKNLESITNELNQNPIEIKCRIAQSSISDIQNQLGKLTKGININVNANSIQKGLEVNKTNLTQQAKEIEKALNLVYPKGHTEEYRTELKKLISEYTKAYDAEGGWGEQAQKNMTELIRFANSYRQEISLTNDDLRDTQEEIKRIKREQQQLFITADQYNALDKYAREDGTNAKDMLDKALGVGRWSANANTYKFDKPYYWSNFAENVNQINPLRDAIIDEGDIIQGIKDLSEFMDKSFIHIDDTLEKNEEAYIQWGNTVIETINSVTGRNLFADGFVDVGTEALDNSVEAIGEDIEEITEQTEYWRRQQELLLQSYEKTIAKIDKAKLSVDKIASREEVTSGDIVNYNERFLDLMERGITDASSYKEAKDALSAFNKEWELANAKMASEIPTNAIEGLMPRIAKLDSQIKILKIDFDKINEVPDKLQASFDKLNETMKDFDFSSEYEVKSKEELSERVKQYTQIKVALNDAKSALSAYQKEEKEADEFARKIDSHNKEIQKRLELKEQEIQKAKELNEAEMHNYWQERFEESVKGMTAENAGLKALKEQLLGYNKAAKEAEIQQKKAFQEDNRLANLQNRISRLTAEVNKYASANQRATNSMKQMSNGKTFAVEWSRITTEMAKGADLTDRELKDLSADMAVFRKEAQAAGLAGDSAFGKFLKSFKVMSSYISANMVFNFVKRQIRELVNEVTEVDTAMTELRKVTEATNDEFAEFARSAGQTGRELGASVSDVINATAEFARLGESLPDAEELGRVATLYKNVGDGIDITTASEDIVSTMKAFKIEAKDAITIVDKLNEVGELCCP